MKKPKTGTDALSTVITKKARKTKIEQKNTDEQISDENAIGNKEENSSDPLEAWEAQRQKREILEAQAEIDEYNYLEYQKPRFGPPDLRPKFTFISKIPETNNSDLKRQYKLYEPISGELALHVNRNIRKAREILISEFPYAVNIIDGVLTQQARRLSSGKTSTLIEPVLLLGAPGLGKSRLARKICEALGVHYRCISVAGMSDANIFGVSRGWGTATPSMIAELVQEAGYPNPVVILDELEKVTKQDRNGTIYEKLLGVLEKSEACRFFEPFFAVPVDASQIGWMFTANSLEGIPGPLRSRLTVLEMTAPTVEHLPHIIRNMRAEIAHDQGLDPRWVRGLDGAEMEAIISSYKEHKSVRILRAQLKHLVSAREMVVQ